MNNLTRRKIAYNFNVSPYKRIIKYSDGDELTFIFSSELYREKFSEQLEENRYKINASLSNRFNFNIVNNKLCDLKLYITIEKRGFLIYKGPVKIECLNEITLNGENLMKNS